MITLHAGNTYGPREETPKPISQEVAMALWRENARLRAIGVDWKAIWAECERKAAETLPNRETQTVLQTLEWHMNMVAETVDAQLRTKLEA